MGQGGGETLLDINLNLCNISAREGFYIVEANVLSKGAINRQELLTNIPFTYPDIAGLPE